MKNLDKNNAQQAIVLEAVALALALDSDAEVRCCTGHAIHGGLGRGAVRPAQNQANSVQAMTSAAELGLLRIFRG